MKWIRKKKYRSSKEGEGKFHLDYHGEPSLDTHYLTTKCQCEIKGMYGHWEIKEDPPKHECCTKCLQRC